MLAVKPQVGAGGEASRVGGDRGAVRFSFVSNGLYILCEDDRGGSLERMHVRQDTPESTMWSRVKRLRSPRRITGRRVHGDDVCWVLWIMNEFSRAMDEFRVTEALAWAEL